jgi:hypothetical protein
MPHPVTGSGISVQAAEERRGVGTNIGRYVPPLCRKLLSGGVATVSCAIAAALAQVSAPWQKAAEARQAKSVSRTADR